MLYDVRTYTCRPGTIKKHLELYAKLGYEVQQKHLGKPVAYMQTDVGNVNSFMHIWGFANVTDRDQRRAKMQEDPAWQLYLKTSAEAGYLVSQENRLMQSAPFFTP